MIVGTGDVASVLIDRDDVIFFASGVSNSREENIDVFVREYRLLREQDHSKHLVYFSSLSIYYSNSMYADHKKTMERIIKRDFNSYSIVRLGNINWGTNPNTLINYLANKIKNNEPYEVHNVYRHIVSKEEFLYWMGLIRVGERNEMNIPGKFVFVPDLVKEIKARLYD